MWGVELPTCMDGGLFRTGLYIESLWHCRRVYKVFTGFHGVG